MRMRRSSSTSRKPSVVIRAVRAPLRSRIAFVATVVAWTISSIAAASMTRESSRYRPTPSVIARA